jgi:hypothetical protein
MLQCHVSQFTHGQKEPTAMNALHVKRFVLALSVALILISCRLTVDWSDSTPAPLPSTTAVRNTEVPWPSRTALTPTPYPWAATPRSRPGGWRTIQSSAYGFSFQVPPGSSDVIRSAGRDRINLPIAAGTNLAEKYIEVAVVEGSHSCRSPLGSAATVSQPRVFNGTRFLMESGADVAAGNFYEWTAYSTSNGTACISLTFVLRSHDVDAYQSPIQHFNSTYETAVFSAIMSTYLHQ